MERRWSDRSYLREGTVVPNVALVGEAVADEAELALFDVLLDGVEFFLLGDLENGTQHVSITNILFLFPQCFLVSLSTNVPPSSH